MRIEDVTVTVNKGRLTFDIPAGMTGYQLVTLMDKYKEEIETLKKQSL